MSGKVFNEKCVITGEPARYRDPATGQPYATLAAFKILRERFAEQGGSVPTPQEVAAKAAEVAQEKEHERAHQRAETAASEADGDVRVTPQQLAALDASTEVKNLLNDDDIARLVREIDSSKDSHTALLDARSNPAMAELMSRILTAVGEDQLPDDVA
mmetsp:Transcript_27256/g.43756  ORF Transcript_27256/g.43756 Transcript_27256/m.43756 type:complete len:158 (+) Transcript_27256:189-662(+)|eukprot:CAMPEP_0179416402 /NCGR_PEP_ID=MMETSP0799-20121207/6775_1 /TAXON_ID=46947 /ORGANISM="Geminigera cryophila, Strain CCMP2564" /LENGTH=157 /DNA_ID=CAMNT_0021189263 /DNA_START=119 /DNA_END=592 /DNA_ORIENTATION=+